MPTFCRHNRLVQNCPICSREQEVALRPVVSSSAPRSTQARPAGSDGARRPAAKSAAPGGVRVRRLARGSDDGYRSPLVPGLKSSHEAQRLAEDLALAATRLSVLEHDPPGLYAEVADAAGELEERLWLAFLIAYVGPSDADDPFAAIAAVRTPWAGAEVPDLSDVAPGPRGAHDPGRGARTLDAYRAWASRAGSQQAALAGDPGWTPQRRFARAFERLALPGFQRDARFELLVSLGRLGAVDVTAGSLAVGGDNPVTLGAKRALGIGDPILLDRRAAELAQACGLPLEALDLALHNWERGERHRGGLAPDTEPDDGLLAGACDALGL